MARRRKSSAKLGVGALAALVVVGSVVGGGGDNRVDHGRSDSSGTPPAIVQQQEEPKVDRPSSTISVDSHGGSKPAPEQIEKVYVASSESDKYHKPSCRYAKSILESNRHWFSSASDASAAGYSPCGTCNPK